MGWRERRTTTLRKTHIPDSHGMSNPRPTPVEKCVSSRAQSLTLTNSHEGCWLAGFSVKNEHRWRGREIIWCLRKRGSVKITTKVSFGGPLRWMHFVVWKIWGENLVRFQFDSSNSYSEVLERVLNYGAVQIRGMHCNALTRCFIYRYYQRKWAIEYVNSKLFVVDKISLDAFFWLRPLGKESSKSSSL